MSQRCIDLIKHFEGFSPRRYICPSGWPTIGYGHVMKKWETYPDTITDEMASNLLNEDVRSSQAAVRRLIISNVSLPRFDALVSFTFNLGAGALQRSTLRAKINREEHDDVPAEFAKWVYGAGKILPGLVKRRQAEAYLYTNGINIFDKE